jgi:hypothetical protein
MPSRGSTLSALVLSLLLLPGCGGGGSGTTPAPPPPPQPTGFTITSVSPATVDAGATLGISYTGPAPSATGNPVTATFQQGQATQTAQLASSTSLGNSSYTVYFRVPTGFASDVGLLPIASTVMLSNSQSKSTAQNIQIAAAPSLVLFPNEVYLGDSGVTLRLHGNSTHFDQNTAVSGTGGVQITGTTLISSDDLVVTLNVTASTAGSTTLTVTSGASDPKTTETASATLAVASLPSPLIGASSLSVRDAPPGTIIQIQGLFQTPDSVDHNVVTWTVAGQSFEFQPASVTSGALNVMVPLWPNADGTFYAGPAQLQVRASGQTSQFDFNIDGLPANPNARGVVFTALLNAFSNSLPSLQNALTAVYSSSTTLSNFQTLSNDALGIVAQFQTFVTAEQAGNAAIPPGGTTAITPEQFDLMEQLLYTSGAYSQAAAMDTQIVFHPKVTRAADASVGESAVVTATGVCRAASEIPTIINYVEAANIAAALVAAATGTPAGEALATILLQLTTALELFKRVDNYTQVMCLAFPISLTRFHFQPSEFSFADTIQPAAIQSLTGTFSVCTDVVSAVAKILEIVVTKESRALFGFLPVGNLLDQIIKKAVTFETKVLIGTTAEILKPLLQKYLGLSLDIVSFDVGMSAGTVSPFSANPSVALPLLEAGSMLVQPVGTGQTQIRADLNNYDLLLNPSSTCDITTDSLAIPGNSAQVTVQGPPLILPGGSGSGTGIIPGTFNGQPIDKAYVAVPGVNVVSVINADGNAHTAPLKSIPMPTQLPGYSPSATAADSTSLKVYVVSYTSPSVVVIDANSDSVLNNFPLPVTHTQGFSGGNCMVCGVLADPIAKQVIFDTADGYLLYDETQGLIVQTYAVNAAENFGYNPVTRQLVSPYYGAPFFSNVYGMDLLDLGTDTRLSFSGSVGPKPDAAAVDFTTNLAVIANEAETNPVGFVTLVNLNAQTLTSGSFSTPTSTYTFPDATSYCSGGADSPEWTMPSADTLNHLLFLANEFSDCAGVLDLPPLKSTGVPRKPSQFRFGEMPAGPDGQVWSNSHDPHGATVFVSVVDGRTYAFLTRLDGLYVARIDLLNLFNSPVIANTPGVVDMTPLAVFLPTR